MKTTLGPTKTSSSMVTSSRKQPLWMRTRLPMRLPNSSTALVPMLTSSPTHVVLADAGALAGLQAGAEGAPGVDGRERPHDGAGADDERQLALAGAPRRLAEDARRLQVAALAERHVRAMRT